MDNKSCKGKEAELKKAINKALSKLKKTIENEPALVIEAGSDSGADTALLGDVQSWLFRRRGEHNDD